MRRQLEDWYSRAKVRDSSNRKAKYEKARPLEGEALSIYATRLEHLFRQAYPHKDLDGKDLKRRLMSSLPRGVVDCLERDLAVVKVSHGIPTTWETVISLLNAQDEIARRHSASTAPEVGEPVVQQPWSGARPKQGNIKVANITTTTRQQGPAPPRQRPRSRSGSRHSRSSSPAQLPHCRYCDKFGHTARDCRRRLNLCLRCGADDHYVPQCPQPAITRPRNSPQNQRRNQANQTQRRNPANQYRNSPDQQQRRTTERRKTGRQSSSSSDSNRRRSRTPRRQNRQTVSRQPDGENSPLNSSPLGHEMGVPRR